MKIKGKLYSVRGIEWNRNLNEIVTLDVVGQPGRGASLPLDSWIKLKAQEEGTPSTGPKEGFVTQYAKKNADENFAEMISAYCLDKLTPHQIEQLEQIIK